MTFGPPEYAIAVTVTPVVFKYNQYPFKISLNLAVFFSSNFFKTAILELCSSIVSQPLVDVFSAKA